MKRRTLRLVVEGSISSRILCTLSSDLQSESQSWALHAIYHMFIRDFQGILSFHFIRNLHKHVSVWWCSSLGPTTNKKVALCEEEKEKLFLNWNKNNCKVGHVNMGKIVSHAQNILRVCFHRFLLTKAIVEREE